MANFGTNLTTRHPGARKRTRLPAVLLGLLGTLVLAGCGSGAAEGEHQLGGEANITLPSLDIVSFHGITGSTLLLIGIGICVLGLIFGLLSYSTLEKLPVLIADDGTSVYESRFILEYLELKHPTPAMLPRDVDGIIAAKRLEVLCDGICDALILDDKSRSDTYPVMEIDENDTSISHEATVSKVSDEQLFYLQSRGIPESLEPRRIDEAIAQIEVDQQLEQLMQQLTGREAEIMRFRYGLMDGEAHTLEETGKQFGLTRERIRQIEKDVMRRLRVFVAEHSDDFRP